MIRTITMTFEADAAALAKAAAALFGATPFGYCIEIATGDNPMCEAKRPDEEEEEKMIVCFKCGKPPEEIPEFVDAARHYNPPISARDYVIREEGTYNPDNERFACTDCYVKLGMPSLRHPRRWVAP